MALKVFKLEVMHQTYSMKGGSFYTGETYRRIQFDGYKSKTFSAKKASRAVTLCSKKSKNAQRDVVPSPFEFGSFASTAKRTLPYFNNSSLAFS